VNYSRNKPIYGSYSIDKDTPQDYLHSGEQRIPSYSLEREKNSIKEKITVLSKFAQTNNRKKEKNDTKFKLSGNLKAYQDFARNLRTDENQYGESTPPVGGFE